MGAIGEALGEVEYAGVFVDFGMAFFVVGLLRGWHIVR